MSPFKEEALSQFNLRHNLKVTRSGQAKHDPESKRRPGDGREPGNIE